MNRRSIATAFILLAALVAALWLIMPVRAAMPPSLVTPTTLTAKRIDAACDAVPGAVLTASLACAAYEFKSANREEVRINIYYDYGTATKVQLWLDGSDSGTTVGDVPWFTESVGDSGASPPKIVMGAQYMEWTPAAADFYQSLTLKGPFPLWTRLRFSSTGGGANDKVTVTLEQR